MLLLNFPHAIRIQNIVNTLPPNTCGSASACIVFEKLGLPYDPHFFVENGRDGNATPDYRNNGSSVIGTALAIAKTNLVDVEVYWDYNPIVQYDELEPYEKPIVEEIKQLRNLSFFPSIDIAEIDAKMSEDDVPILAFKRDGIESNGHFSPLRGINVGNSLILPLQDGTGSCNCTIEDFTQTWWTVNDGRPCILVKKRR